MEASENSQYYHASHLADVNCLLTLHLCTTYTTASAALLQYWPLEQQHYCMGKEWLMYISSTSTAVRGAEQCPSMLTGVTSISLAMHVCTTAASSTA